MDQEFNIQVKFFEELKNKILPNQSLADIISDELKIGIDSAYRRIRGETSLSIEELKRLSDKFKISLDAIFTSTSDSVLFSYRAIKPEKFNYEAYFNSIIDNMKALSVFDLKEIIYSAKDMPFFYNFILPEFAAFKLFFWMRNIYNFPELENKIFDPREIPENVLVSARKVWESYIHIPSVEIWNDESVNITLRQIEYYHNCGRFRDKSVALELLEKYQSLVLHVQKQAESGCKFLFGKEPWNDDTNFRMYYNEVVIGDNTVLFKMGNFNMVHMGHNLMNIISTTDPSFCNDTNQIFKNMMKNSTLISVTGEKERNMFFNQMNRKINDYIAKINSA